MEASKTTQKKLLALIVIFSSIYGMESSFAQTAEPKNSARPNLAKTTRNADYSKPIYFDILGSKEMPVPLFDYKLLEKGTQLQMGPVIIDEKTFSFGLRRLNEIDTKWAVPGESYFFVKWPESFFTEARIELLSRDGNAIWKKELRKEDLQAWKKTVRKELKSPKSSIHQINWATEFKSTNLPLQGLADGFRFCISRLQENAQERLCSQNYVVRQAGAQTLLGRLKEMTTARVLLEGEAAPDFGEIKAEAGLPIRFFAQLATGETLEFSSKPLPVAWSDFTKLEGTDLYTVVGHEVPPIGKYRIINPERYPKWVKAVGFEPTILDNRKFWAIQVKSADPWLYFQGETGGLFRHPLPINKAPASKIRLHLSKRTPTGTYRDGVKLKGRKQASTNLSSQDYQITDFSANEFTWSFKAKNNARINRSTLLLNDGGQSYHAYYELYKGYSNELSTRLSMILSTSGLILMGEAAYNIWFEDVLGWDNYYFSKQRWGLGAKFFQSITKFNVKGYGDATLNVLNVDLKYRLTPGLWTRDESHGLMASYQNFDANLQITSFKVPMMGVGWFWARSMPKSIDEIFNLIPFMNYPKWVDMEFIYYAASTDSTKKLNFNFALNFHGQVLWKDNFFGEAGFGIKRYDFVDMTNTFQRNLGYQLNTLYGTVGLGLKF